MPPPSGFVCIQLAWSWWQRQTVYWHCAHIHDFEDPCACFSGDNSACVSQTPTLSDLCFSELTLSPPFAFLCPFVNAPSPAGEVAAVGVGRSCQPVDWAAFLGWWQYTPGEDILMSLQLIPQGLCRFAVVGGAHNCNSLLTHSAVARVLDLVSWARNKEKAWILFSICLLLACASLRICWDMC